VSGHAGFTLVELMVVIVVLTILTAMIVPEFSGTHEEALLRAAGRDLVSAMKYAASQAVTRHQDHRLHIDPVQGAYWLEAQNRKRAFFRISDSVGTIDGKISIRVRRHDPPLMDGDEEVPPPRSLALDQLPPEIMHFHADGTADGREILLRDPSGFGLRLILDASTALVHLTRLDQEAGR